MISDCPVRFVKPWTRLDAPPYSRKQHCLTGGAVSQLHDKTVRIQRPSSVEWVTITQEQYFKYTGLGYD
jgi:hypothetical protein